MGPSWREGSWGDGWGRGPAACQHRRCLGVWGCAGGCRGLQRVSRPRSPRLSLCPHTAAGA